MCGGAEVGAGPLPLILGLFLSLSSLMSLTVWLSFPGYLFDTVGFHVGGALAKLQVHSAVHSTCWTGWTARPRPLRDVTRDASRGTWLNG